MLLMLLEGLAYAAEEEGGNGFTMAEIWQHSGMIARAVIVTLTLMLIGTFIVGFERFIAFMLAKSHSKALVKAIVKPLEAGDVAGALKLASDKKYKSGYMSGLLRAGLSEFSERRDEFGLANAKRAVEKAHTEEIAKLQRGMTVLATVGSTAPFVGLFGTTMGVINAFAGMSTGGSGLASISAGISEALITTAAGIFVAIVGVWIFNYFNARIAKVTDELNSSEADFIQWATKLLQPAGK